MDHSKRRRKVIKKLDFENCEVTNIRMRKTTRKRLKARTISEYEDEIVPTLQSQGTGKDSRQLENEEEREHNSPILFRKFSSQKEIHTTSSPVLVSKQKFLLMKGFKIEDEPKPSTSAFGESGTTTSPIFKFRIGADKKVKKSKLHTPDKNKPSLIITSDDDCSADECDIEDLSQEQTTEIPEEYEVSVFSSENAVCSNVNISDLSGESLSLENEHFTPNTPTFEDNTDTSEECHSDEGSSNEYQRGGLIEKLFELRKKQSSEKRICDHNRKLMNFEKVRRRKLHVIETWKSSTRLTLKCQYVDVSEDVFFVNSDKTDFVYIILNRDKKKFFNKIKSGTFLRITAPWQEIRLPSLKINILLSVTFIELIDSISDIKTPRTVLREISIVKYKEDEALFFDDLFAPIENILFH